VANTKELCNYHSHLLALDEGTLSVPIQSSASPVSTNTRGMLYSLFRLLASSCSSQNIGQTEPKYYDDSPATVVLKRTRENQQSTFSCV
jgi:hypothetical protein